MAAAFPGAIQVGSYFVGQYYQILQQQPHLAYQFYTDASTVMRIDGDAIETATATMQIHSLITTLNFTGIEIKTANSLESWNGGVMVVVSGYVLMKDYTGRRKFVQSFFLAPQEKGYFVLSDIFNFVDEEPMQQPSETILPNNNYEANLSEVNQVPEPVSGYMHGQEIEARDYVDAVHVVGEDIQSRDYVSPVHVHTDENDTGDVYNMHELQQQVSESNDWVDETPAEQQHWVNETTPAEQHWVNETTSAEQQHWVNETPAEQQHWVNETPAEVPVASFQSTMNTMDLPSAHIQEPAAERPKQTYASILRLARGQPGNSMSHVAPSSRNTTVASDAPLATPQQSYPAFSTRPEKPSSEAFGEATTFEDEGEVKSVYVGNLPSSVSAADLEHEFKNFGRIRPDGVVVRSRKDSGGLYAFVEFEDTVGVENALKASPILLNGWQIYVEERRPNSGLSRGGRGRGRGRGGYPFGRFGGRSSGNDRDYNNSRSRGNGVQRSTRQERGILGSHAMRNEQNSSEWAS